MILKFIIQIFIDAPQNTQDLVFFKSFVEASLTEELLRFLSIIIFLRVISTKKEPTDYFKFGTLIGLGFATLENIAYASNENYGVIEVTIYRALTSTPMHACNGAIMSTLIYYSKSKKPFNAILLPSAIILPIIIHGFYNYDVFLTESFSQGLVEFDKLNGIGLISLILSVFMR